MSENKMSDENATKKRKPGVSGEEYVRDGKFATPVSTKIRKQGIPTGNTYAALENDFPALKDVTNMTEKLEKKKNENEQGNEKNETGKEEKEEKEKNRKTEKPKNESEFMKSMIKEMEGMKKKSVEDSKIVSELTSVVYSLKEMINVMQKEREIEKGENEKCKKEMQMLREELEEKNKEIARNREENSNREKENKSYSPTFINEEKEKKKEWVQVVGKKTASKSSNVGKVSDIKACFSFKNTGACPFGSACKFAKYHTTEKKPICFYFAKDKKCMRGVDCKFRHEDPLDGEIHTFTKVNVCRKFVLGRCSGQCPQGFAHQLVRKSDKPCRIWEATQGCHFGILCRYRHNEISREISDEDKAESKPIQNEIES
jgi:hypothetical protein